MQDEGGRRSVQENHRMETEYDEVEDEESDADDFIVDDDGHPITEKKKKVKYFNPFSSNLNASKTKFNKLF